MLLLSPSGPDLSQLLLKNRIIFSSMEELIKNEQEQFLSPTGLIDLMAACGTLQQLHS